MRWLLFLMFLKFLRMSVKAACQDAPTPAAKIICEQLHEMDTQAVKDSEQAQMFEMAPGVPAGGGSPGRPGLPGLSAPMQSGWAPVMEKVVTNIRECMDLSCVCEMLTGNRSSTCTYRGKRVEKLIRKEYRQMSDFERQRFHEAINQMKRTGAYNEIAKMHSDMSQAGGAHSGPAFLPWHREFLKEIELELRRIDPEIYLPYWDSSLEARLPRPQDSALFTSELMGTGQGVVTDGPFANWRTIENVPLRRQAGKEASPMTDSDIAYVLNLTTINKMLAFTAERAKCQYRLDYHCLEYAHGNPHLWVGGQMLLPKTAANDPIFFLHHAFVDLLWEMWRQATQNREQRESDYTEDNELCSSTQHFRSSPMSPFNPLLNEDGLSNQYTDGLYEYAPRPNCGSDQNCGSRFLFCDVSHGAPRCAAKIRIGGSCQGFVQDEDACYNGICHENVCRPKATITTTTVVTPVIAVRPPVPEQKDCWNENQCCQHWANRGECTKNPRYMRTYCKASCNVCRPNPPIQDDCSDRHRTCASWSRRGECTKNPNWMKENCRRSCDYCQQTREQACTSGHNKSMTTTSTQAPTNIHEQCENSPGCYNEYACCPLWAVQGQCGNSSSFMTCNCRVSCLLCIPPDYPYGECVDYAKGCRAWARRGECRRNSWMEENCRASCNTCFAMHDLRSRCEAAGSTRLIGTIHQEAQA